MKSKERLDFRSLPPSTLFSVLFEHIIINISNITTLWEQCPYRWSSLYIFLFSDKRQNITCFFAKNIENTVWTILIKWNSLSWIVGIFGTRVNVWCWKALSNHVAVPEVSVNMFNHLRFLFCYIYSRTSMTVSSINKRETDFFCSENFYTSVSRNFSALECVNFLLNSLTEKPLSTKPQCICLPKRPNSTSN